MLQVRSDVRSVRDRELPPAGRGVAGLRDAGAGARPDAAQLRVGALRAASGLCVRAGAATLQPRLAPDRARGGRFRRADARPVAQHPERRPSHRSGRPDGQLPLGRQPQVLPLRLHAQVQVRRLPGGELCGHMFCLFICNVPPVDYLW